MEQSKYKTLVGALEKVVWAYQETKRETIGIFGHSLENPFFASKFKAGELMDRASTTASGYLTEYETGFIEQAKSDQGKPSPIILQLASTLEAVAELSKYEDSEGWGLELFKRVEEWRKNLAFYYQEHKPDLEAVNGKNDREGGKVTKAQSSECEEVLSDLVMRSANSPAFLEAIKAETRVEVPEGSCNQAGEIVRPILWNGALVELSKWVAEYELNLWGGEIVSWSKYNELFWYVGKRHKIRLAKEKDLRQSFSNYQKREYCGN